MALNIEARWAQPLALTISRAAHEIYFCPDHETIPDSPGVYVFARRHGEVTEPLYIGQSRNLYARLRQHLDSVSLMQSIREASAGARLFLYCEPILRPGQQLVRVLDTLEEALIDHALAEGHALLNVQGTRCPTHAITFSGNRTSEALAPRRMFVKISL